MVIGGRYPFSLSLHRKFDFVRHFSHRFRRWSQSLGIQRRTTLSAQDLDRNRIFDVLFLLVDVQRKTRKSTISSLTGYGWNQKPLGCPQRNEHEQKPTRSDCRLFINDRLTFLARKYYEPTLLSFRLLTRRGCLYWPHHAHQWSHWLNSIGFHPWQDRCIQKSYLDLNNNLCCLSIPYRL